MKKMVKITVFADLLFFFMIFAELQFNMSQHARMLLFGLASAAASIMIIYALVKEIGMFFLNRRKSVAEKERVSSFRILLSLLFSGISLYYVGRFFLIWIVVSNV